MYMYCHLILTPLKVAVLTPSVTAEKRSSLHNEVERADISVGKITFGWLWSEGTILMDTSIEYVLFPELKMKFSIRKQENKLLQKIIVIPLLYLTRVRRQRL